MELTKLYVIKTGNFHKENGDKEIYWYDDLKTEMTDSGYKRFHFYPLEYPVFTTFEEADKACRSDWHDQMFEEWDNFAKVCEYTMTGGLWYLSHEWFYTTEDDYKTVIPVDADKGVYKLYKETGFSEEGEHILEILYKKLKIH